MIFPISQSLALRLLIFLVQVNGLGGDQKMQVIVSVAGGEESRKRKKVRLGSL